ncbi:MAG TPA: cation:proton antiporter [Gemmatimonadaceae bacterium]|nr:cation:proton antiporter [Gemmatimonadaceae bacterium]
MDYFTSIVALIGIVIVVASLLSRVVERVGVPFVAVFLVLGAILGPLGLGLLDIHLEDPSLRTLAILALALVLFSDAVTIETRMLRTQRKLLWRLLGPGTLLPAAVIAFFGWLLLDLSVPAAAIVGAALASTDPVLLRTVTRSRALSPLSRAVLRLEGGVNDVVLLPIVVLAMIVAREGADGLTGAELGHHALGLFVLGPALGGVVGWVGITLLASVRDRIGVRRDYEALYALGLALSAYASAEAVGGSGFLAAFTAGFIVSVQDVELCDCFLEYGEATAEMLLLLTFVALGTSLIWSGLSIIDGRMLLFAFIALFARTVALFPLLVGTGMGRRDRTLVALFGPRGLSSLLFALLPVFDNMAGAEDLFAIVCLVVLLSVVLHGGGIALFLRRNTPRDEGPAPVPEPVAAEEPQVPERITLAELAELRERGEPTILVDARAERSYNGSDLQASGSVRLQPDDPVRSALEQRLSRQATLVVYCA